MKRIINIISIMFCSFFGNAQDIPVMDDILSIQPKWSYVLVDTNFYNLAPPENLYTPYWGRLIQSSVVKTNNIYLLENGLHHAFNPGGFDGYSLHNIDLETGLPIWIHHDNFFTGNTHQITSFAGNLVELENGNLIVNGNRNIDPLDTTTINYSGDWYGTPFRHEINFENGQLIDEKYDPDTSHTSENLFPRMLTKSIGNGEQFKIRITSKLHEGFLKNYLNLYIIDENSIVNKVPDYTYEHNTNIPNGLEHFTYRNVYAQLNHDTGVAIFGSKDPTLINTPTEIKLLYFDTSDPHNVFIKKEIDVLDIIPKNQNELINYVHLRVEDNKVLLTQKVLIGEGTTTEEAYLWLTWFDEYGNRLGTAERLSYDGFDYQLLSGIEFYNDALYALLFSDEISDLNTYHFYKIEPNTEPQLIAEFEHINPELDHIIGLGNLEFTDDLDVVISFNIQYIVEDDIFENLRSNVIYICKFNSADFGLQTNSLQKEKPPITIELFPNPVDNVLYVRTTKVDYFDNISIYDLSGRKVISLFGDVKEIDVSFLKSGLYKAIISIDHKTISHSFIKI